MCPCSAVCFVLADVYLELWEDKADIEDNPDAVLYKQKYTDIQTDPGLSVVQVSGKTILQCGTGEW